MVLLQPFPKTFLDGQRALAIGGAAVNVSSGQSLVEGFAANLNLYAAATGAPDISAYGVERAVEGEHACVIKPG